MLETEITIDEVTIDNVTFTFDNLTITYQIEPQNGGEIYDWEISFNGATVPKGHPWETLLNKIATKYKDNAIEQVSDEIEPFNPRTAYGV